MVEVEAFFGFFAQVTPSIRHEPRDNNSDSSEERQLFFFLAFWLFGFISFHFYFILWAGFPPPHWFVRDGWPVLSVLAIEVNKDMSRHKVSFRVKNSHIMSRAASCGHLVTNTLPIPAGQCQREKEREKRKKKPSGNFLFFLLCSLFFFAGSVYKPGQNVESFFRPIAKEQKTASGGNFSNLSIYRGPYLVRFSVSTARNAIGTDKTNHETCWKGVPE